ncbi:MAG: single-stranded DNA-binding protein, partial [Gammaproteobacteria bacterium]|nr:single-stranded DNA-binding protein [Gammaproteobacteria bacterium]
IALGRETKLQKGDLIAVEGKIKYRKYTDKEGVEKYITEISAYKTELLNRKDYTQKSEPQPVEKAEELPVSKDDLPF